MKGNKIKFELIITILACIAAWLALPQIQVLLNGEKDSTQINQIKEQNEIPPQTELYGIKPIESYFDTVELWFPSRLSNCEVLLDSTPAIILDRLPTRVKFRVLRKEGVRKITIKDGTRKCSILREIQENITTFIELNNCK